MIRVKKVKIILGYKRNELLFDLSFSILGKIHNKNACVHVSIGVYTDCFFGIFSEFGCVLYELLGCGGENIISDIYIIKLRNITKHYKIAIQINYFIVVWEK